MRQKYSFHQGRQRLFALNEKVNGKTCFYDIKSINILSADGYGKIVSRIKMFIFRQEGTFGVAEVPFSLPMDSLQTFTQWPRLEKYPIMWLQNYNPESKLNENDWILNIQEDYAKWTCGDLKKFCDETTGGIFAAKGMIYRDENIGLLKANLRSDKVYLEKMIQQGRDFITEHFQLQDSLPDERYDDVLPKTLKAAEYERNCIANLVECWKTETPDAVYRTSCEYLQQLNARWDDFDKEIQSIRN